MCQWLHPNLLSHHVLSLDHYEHLNFQYSITIIQRTLKWLALLFLSISPLITLLALGFSFLTTSPVIGLVLFYMILGVSVISKIVFYVALSGFN